MFCCVELRDERNGAEGRTAAIGRDRRETAIAEPHEHERYEEGDKRRIIFIDRTSPDDPRTDRSQAMVASIAIPPAMEIKRSGLRRFPIAETGRTDKPSSEANADEQASKQRNQPRGPSGSIGRMHGAKEIVHRIVLQRKRRVAYDTGQEMVYRRLLTDATVQAVKRQTRKIR